MIENFIGLAIGVTVAFFCMYFYRRGLKDGMDVANSSKPKPIIEKPSFMQTTEEKMEHETIAEQRRAEKAEAEFREKMNAEAAAIMSFQAKHMGGVEED